MNLATLLRRPTSDEGTLGALALVDTDLAWTSLELPWRDNKPHLSCILAGRYHCELRESSKWSPRHDHLLYWVLGVPGRTAIEIHAATWAGDVLKGWHTELLGCIAPGKKEGSIAPPELDHAQRCILQSRMALKEFMDALRGQPFDLEVSWAT